MKSSCQGLWTAENGENTVGEEKIKNHTKLFEHQK